MNKIPLNLIIFSSTKGHFGNRERYLQTVQSLNAQIPIKDFLAAYIHIKVSSGEETIANEMTKKLEPYGFNIFQSNGNWKHDDNSHQLGYLNDMFSVYMDDAVQEGQYSLVMEDDFIVKSYEKDLYYFLNKAVSILEKVSNCTQVRIPRFSNEFERINGLKAKHNINGMAIRNNNEPDIFYQNDWSNNMFVARTRELRNALLMIRKNSNVFPFHSEHGVGMAMKYFSVIETPFCCFEPTKIRCGHIGTLPNQEDNLDKELNT